MSAEVPINSQEHVEDRELEEREESEEREEIDSPQDRVQLTSDPDYPEDGASEEEWEDFQRKREEGTRQDEFDAENEQSL